MGMLLRWAIQESVLTGNQFKVYDYESNRTDEGAADSIEAEIPV